MKRKKIILLALIAIILLPFKNVYAAGLGISANSKSVVTGGSVKVTVSASGIAGRFSVTSSNSGVLSGGEASVWLENDSKTYTFSAKSVGSATITITPINAAFSDGSGKVTSAKSVTINVVKPREKSNNNNLKSLSVEGFEITPAFNRDTLEYSLEVGDEVESIKINANMEDGYGHATGTGDFELAEGTNTFEIKGVSETGLEKVYKLTVNVKDNNPINETFEGKTYSLVKRASSLVLPECLNKELFVETKVEIEGTQIPAYISETLGFGLVGLKDDKGTIYLFKLIDGKIDKKYEILNSTGINIEFIDAKNIPEGYSKTVIDVNGKEYTVYQNEYKNYALIYGKNIESGKENWYVYDINEKTIQSYKDEEIKKLNEEIKNEKAKNNILLISIAGVSGIFLIIIIIEIVFNRKMRKTIKKASENHTIESVEIKEVIESIDEPKEEIIKEKKKTKGKQKKKEEIKEEVNEEMPLENVEIAEKVEVKPKEEKKTKGRKKKVEENIETTDENIPTIEEITEDLKPIEDIKFDTEEEEALREMEEFYGKVKKSKRNRL